MDALLRLFLNTLIRRGTLHVTTANGTTFSVGDGRDPTLGVRFRTMAAQRGILLDPELRLGEAYMDGDLAVEGGSIADLLDLVLSQPRARPPFIVRLRLRLRYLIRRIQQHNRKQRAGRNVAHHYDLDGRLYSLFLDGDKQYSCGYFERPDQSLDEAQVAKRRHIAAKLLMRPGQTALDIGCGWGGFAFYLAEICGARVTGITLSREQLAAARERAEEKGLTGAVQFALTDYRDVDGTFDRIVSVGMFEHVGVNFYGAYFRAVAKHLADDGVALIHSIGRSEGPTVTNPWIAKYIFPGGYIPALSEVMPAIERSGLLVTDVEILRLHYAETLKAWRERFLAHREEAERLADARFVRMWEFYLAASEMAFRHEGLMVMQIQLAKRQGVVPITRDYIAQEEDSLRRAEREARPPLRLAGE